ncbi:MAG: hypothetical protein ACREK6_01195 [Candidatus Rokuibacteriota bacterium]
MESVVALALSIVTGSAMGQWTKDGQPNDAAWRVAEDGRRQLIAETQRQHALWYVHHVQQVRQAEEGRLARERQETEV